jgi:ribA/ribD-fused uncharacterized protein
VIHDLRLTRLFQLGQRSALLERENQTLDVRLFHLHTQGAHRCGQLALWADAPFVVGGICYTSVGQFVTAAKAETFGDRESRLRILRARTTGEAQARGREVAAFARSIWSELRVEILSRGNLAKVTQNESVREAVREVLLASGDSVLAEASAADQVWAIGLQEDHPSARRPGEWRGGSTCRGFSLMDLRERLQKRN